MRVLQYLRKKTSILSEDITIWAGTKAKKKRQDTSYPAKSAALTVEVQLCAYRTSRNKPPS